MTTTPQLSVELVRIRTVERGRAADFVRRFMLNRMAVVGAAALALLAIIALSAPLVSPYDPLATDPAAARAAPSSGHWLGTDEIGRDELSRLMWGARYSLPVGLIPVFFAAIVGTALGLTAGYLGGFTDTLIMRIVDVVMAFPGILLAVAIVAVLGLGLQNLMFAVGVFSLPLYARLIRGSTLAAKEMTYIEAAVALGASSTRIMLRHILPNVVAPLIVLVTLGAATAILAAASLSFLGLGAQPPTPEWGSMLNSGQRFLRVAWWMSVFPGIAITVTVLAMNMVGDGLRDVLDPRLRD